MRVFVVHNRYSSRVPSGENLAVDDEVRWLEGAGVDVHRFEVSNDDAFAASPAKKVRQAAESVWSGTEQHRMRRALDEVEPDLVHVHNLFPLLSASPVWVAGRRRVPVIWTVHNMRLTCVMGTHFRDGQPCHRCRPHHRLPGIALGCYSSSRPASALVTASTALFGRVIQKGTTAVAISGSVRDWLVATGVLPADRVVVKYNGVAGPLDAQALPPAHQQRVFLFAGHLVEHKGVGLLLEAWKRADLPDDVELRIAGDGPMADVVQAAAQGDPRVHWLGHVDPRHLPEQLSAARVVVVPSTWDEPFGRTAAEALAFARPVITTGNGGLAEIVDPASGWLPGTDPDAMAKALAIAAHDNDKVARFAAVAASRHRDLFSPQATTDALLAVYRAALARVSPSG